MTVACTSEQIKELDGIYVYCSDEIIKQYLPPEVKFVKRDKYYDLSTTPFNMLLKRFATIIEADIYVLAHATAPFIKKSSIFSETRS